MSSPNLNLQEFVGMVTGPPRVGADLVNAPMIRHWCQAIGDSNPIYLDDGAALARGFEGIVAPPTLLASWTHHDRRYPPPPATPEHPESQLVERLDANGYRSVVATNLEQEYVRYLYCGEQITLQSYIDAVSSLKQTAVGDGYFITFRYEYRDDSGAIVGSMMQRVLRFAPVKRESIIESTATAKNTSPIDISKTLPTRSQPPRIGDTLPEIEIPITATLIVAGAIASRDFHVVHHDHHRAQELGSKDIIMNIYVTAGLLGKFSIDWAGPAARMKGISMRLGTSNYPGDIMRISGQVVDVVDRSKDRVLGLTVRGTNSLGDHVTGLFELVVPLD